jgi:hypothetical protein
VEPDGLLQALDVQVAQVDVRAAELEVTVGVAHRGAPVAAAAGLVEHQRAVDFRQRDEKLGRRRRERDAVHQKKPSAFGE